MRNLFLALLFAVPLTALAAPMTNDDVIKMVRGGLGEATVIQAIDAAEPAFDTSPDGLVKLKQGGVSDTVIQRIMARKTGAPATGGAVAGNVYENRAGANKTFEIGVLFDDGSSRSFHMDSHPSWRQGSRVKLVNGALAPL